MPLVNSSVGGVLSIVWIIAYTAARVYSLRHNVRGAATSVGAGVTCLAGVAAVIATPLPWVYATAAPVVAVAAALSRKWQGVACAAGVTASAALLYRDSSTPALISAFAAVAAAAWWHEVTFFAPRKPLTNGLHAGELALLLVLCGADAPLRSGGTHLTWWGVAAVAALDAATLAGRPQTAAQLQTISAFVVLLGTTVLSASECTMLPNTLNDLGYVKYIAGNTVLHYYPATRGLLSHKHYGKPTVNLCLAAFSLACAYAIVVSPVLVYGCKKVPEWAGFGAAPFAVVLFGIYARA